MVRMTDLFKKAKKQKEETPAPLQVEKQPLVTEGKPAIVDQTPHADEIEPVSGKKEQPAQKKQPPEKTGLEFAGIFLQEQNELSPGRKELTQEFMSASIPDKEEVKKIYLESIESVKKIFNAYATSGAIDKDHIINITNKIVNNIILHPRGLLRLFHEIDSFEYYIYYDAVNVCILSVEMGIISKYNKSALLDLATIGLLHDIDLVKSKDIIDKPEKLDNEELARVRKHCINAASFISKTFGFKEEIVNGILQHHERVDGHGYPAGLTENSINELAMIVGLADTYAAMVHSRPDRKKMLPNEAILDTMSKGKELFPKKLIKTLISCIGLYPIGTWIELNTGEIGEVLDINRDYPLRPLINISMDKDRAKLSESRIIDLQKTPSLYIKRPVEGPKEEVI